MDASDEEDSNRTRREDLRKHFRKDVLTVSTTMAPGPPRPVLLGPGLRLQTEDGDTMGRCEDRTKVARAGKDAALTKDVEVRHAGEGRTALQPPGTSVRATVRTRGDESPASMQH